MRAMLLRRLGPVRDDAPPPLELAELPDPAAGPGEIVVAVSVCGVCHTELDEIEGRTPPSRLPRVLGHQVVGTVVERGSGADSFALGARVGVAWIASACGRCRWCERGEENLCPEFRATGRDLDGGYAERMAVAGAFAHPIPESLADATTAPLLCAGAIGWRSLRLAGFCDPGAVQGRRLGLTGFGASGHLVLRLALRLHPGLEVAVFARSERQREFARDLGATWAGDTTDTPPAPLDAIIDTTPAWRPVVEALRHLAPGGRLVINAIRKEDRDREALLGLDYGKQLWLEREIKSVANITRRDVRELLVLAAEIGLAPEVEEYPLEDANRALGELRAGAVRGAKVLRIAGTPPDRATPEAGSTPRNG